MAARGSWKGMLMLALAGGAAFWVANFAVSLTPIAADYRAALSIPYRPMLLAAAIGGLLIGFCVSVASLRLSRNPVGSSVLRAVLLGLVVLVIVTFALEAPASFLTGTRDAVRYFLIGLLFNAVRILALALVIGHLQAGRAFGSGLPSRHMRRYG